MEMMNLYKEKQKVVYLSPEKIIPNPNQPRKHFDQSALLELAQSIKELGIIQPVTVRRKENDTYELIAGERRLRASRLLGYKSIPAILNPMADDFSLAAALVENLQRQDLSFFEEAQGYERLIHSYNFTQEELAKKVGKSQSTIANKLRLLRLPQNIKELLTQHCLTERHARALLKIENYDLMLKAISEIITKNLNVLQTDLFIEEFINDNQNSKKSKENKDQRFVKIFKDIRIFTNTVKQAIEMMQRAGVEASSTKNENDDYIEYVIKINKKASA